jgi:DNA transformation protein and related proteins
MAKKDIGFHEFIMADILGDIPGVKSRAMFGGWGIYQDGTIFGLIDDGKLYFKVGDTNKKDYEALGSEPFKYTMPNGKVMSMSYYELPEQIMENKDELLKWIEKSVKVSAKKK